LASNLENIHLTLLSSFAFNPSLFLCFQQSSYAEEGKDTNDPSSWAYYHLKKCLHPYIDARECQVDKKVAVVRNMKDKLSPEQWTLFQNRMRNAAHKKIGLEKFDEIWNPDLDYSGYFKAYSEHMENQFKLEEEYLKEREGGRDPADPSMYIPKKFYKNTQVYGS